MHLLVLPGGIPFRTERARQRRLEKRNQHRQKLRQKFAEVAAKQQAKKQLARVSAFACPHCNASTSSWYLQHHASGKSSPGSPQ